MTTIYPVGTSATVPDAVDRVRALLALDAAGLATTYQTWADDPSRTFEEKAFIEATVWRRNNPVLIAGATAMGLTSQQIDDLFMAAAKIVLADI